MNFLRDKNQPNKKVIKSNNKNLPGISSVFCDHLEGWDREGGREMQKGGVMGIYVYV